MGNGECYSVNKKNIINLKNIYIFFIEWHVALVLMDMIKTIKNNGKEYKQLE